MRRDEATIWCTCPLCHGKLHTRITEWHAEHLGLDDLFENEVTIEAAPPHDPWDNVPLIFTGTVDDDDHAEVYTLVQVYPADGVAEVSFRRGSWETWGRPTICKAEQ